MGNTIRREPVNFNIPASPDYKFLNITNFRGLDVSSNPFELATNTASDCLNVYVDETNTLTTRPRLEKKELKDNSGNDILPLNGTCLGVYPLHDGYLFHYTQQMKVLRGDKLTEVSAESIPQKACKHFEQGDKIFLLGDGRYMVIDENAILKDVDGYVPIVTTHSEKITEVEPLNLLTDKYLTQVFWDGVNNPFGTTQVETVTKNEAIKKATIRTDLSDYEYIQYFDDDTCLLRHKETNKLFYGVFTNRFTDVLLTDIGITTVAGSSVKAATKGKSIFCVIKEPGYADYKQTAFVYVGDGVWEKKWGYFYDKYDPTKAPLNFGVSPNGNFFWLISITGTTKNFIVHPYRNDAFENGWSIGFDESLMINEPCFTKSNLYDGERSFYFTTSDGTNTVLHKVVQPKNSLDLWAYDDVVTFEEHKNANSFVTEDGEFYVEYYGNDFSDFVFEVNTTNQTYRTKQYPKNMLRFFYRTSTDKNTNYWLDEKQPHNLWVSVRTNENAYYNSFVTIDGEVVYNNYLTRIVTRKNDMFDVYYWDETSPYLTIQQTISTNDKNYEEFNKKRESLLYSNLFARFDNNYWFASGNEYFRTQYNDPTYFPMTETNELGDSNESITGFNIANDTTLLAYKENRLYLIQPFYSETTGTTEYSVTESKNTVGNTAIDAPIVTTLNEIPLQINNDGVYGLSQVSNVSAVERIADLMSEPINDRWLNEDDEVIKKAQTLNRLYWTYVILPYEKLTKVYLLDNRTNSWYYWELPIKLLNAFAKDNHAEFVDTDGNIYYLTTTDIRNMGFDTQLVTEYYDYGKKLIPWHWQSQAMYLGTMNHAKRLVNTTFILTDTDTQDGYGLQYSFKVFRKLASSVPEKELSGDLNLVRSTTKKTNISKFGFLQLKLSNITEDSQGTEAEKAYRNNKLRLVGLGLKYVLLEGLIR